MIKKVYISYQSTRLGQYDRVETGRGCGQITLVPGGFTLHLGQEESVTIDHDELKKALKELDS